jgi:hypothetical protein
MGAVERNSDTTEQTLQQFLASHPFGWQDENGIDLSLISENLLLTPDQRVRSAQAAARQLARMFDARLP